MLVNDVAAFDKALRNLVPCAVFSNARFPQHTCRSGGTRWSSNPDSRESGGPARRV